MLESNHCVDEAPQPLPGECEGPCHFTASGLDEPLYAITRTQDGRVWLAYVITHADVHHEYEIIDVQYSGGFCQATVVIDNTFNELHLLEIPLSGEPPVEVFALDVGPPDWSNVFGMRAFAHALAIGFDVHYDPFDDPRARVLRIDTGLL